MTIFLTGGAGFIGSNFAHYLESKGFNNIVILDKFTYAADMRNLLPLKFNIETIDLASIKHLEKLFKKYKPTSIFHFAAETHVDNSITNVFPFIESNIISTVNLLNLSVKYEIKRFHHISTDEVFGSLNDIESGFTENTAYNPLNPYSASKASSDHFVMAYHNTYKLPVVITNCSNNYGPRQNSEKLIPKVINHIHQKKQIPIYGSGNNIRDWIFVEDHCRAILDIYNGGKIGEKYNIGGECQITNKDLVYKIINIMGASKSLVDYVDDRPGHDYRYDIDNTKIINQFNYKPEFTLTEGLKKTIKWYLQ